ncbi:hypothetical protein PR202_ga01836 [Eleusine coracana subsp. coracana]|uniref:Ankyrin repeat protein n=1 Tax=Eleusine coracana subsp. coracana TaxID=191504 RepID=A0AAV5BHD5_ELECO|nr:hypothetical protein PR202_ga01149 [Eleusine coracana subsp. coracana]GJM86019.1 hypothetical protein PR202_ga01836 [Eleusine coracana subsp. coracana]
MLGYPDYDTFFAAVRKEVFDDYLAHLAPKLRPIVAEDSVKRFCRLCGAWPQYLNVRGLFLPEIIVSLVCHNALRCTRAVLQGTAPQLSNYNVDLNVPHLYGYAPLHVAAEAFNVNMIQLLRHGASANVRTKGSKVIEGLLPLHVAVENAAMHKYLEDHWTFGEPVENLIFLLCLPEMKMYLDTARLIAKHTDNIVDEIWNYIDKDRLVPASILLLAAQKQLRDGVNTSSRKVSLSGFDDVKSRIDAATRALHCEEFSMIKDGKNGRALKNLKHKKQIILTAHVIVGIANVAGEALEKYIQTHSEVLPK